MGVIITGMLEQPFYLPRNRLRTLYKINLSLRKRI
jgi:hypothetical protein